MCKKFNVHDLPTWLVEELRLEAGIYHMTELFVLHCQEKTMEKYYEMLCKILIKMAKDLREQELKQRLLDINPKIKIKIDPFEGEVK